MLLKRHLQVISLFFISMFVSSCTTVYYLEHHPQFAEDVFYRKVLLAERKVLSGDSERLLEVAKLRTQYTYAFIVEKADRIIEEDYIEGKALYAEALISFEKAIENGQNAIQQRHPELKSITDWIMKDVTFTKNDIPYLYWLGAAYGGAISSSRGKAKWVIQLPIVGYLIETAMEIDSSWNYGALHSAMISYSMVRTDLTGKNIGRAKYHFNKALKYSNNNDAGAKVSFAENVHVANQNKSEFENLLNEVIHMDLDKNKELVLGNIIARERALWLLSRIDELFY